MTELTEREESGSARYNIFRAWTRFRLNVARRKLRVVGVDPDFVTGPAIFFVAHPEDVRAASLVAAGLRRRVRVLMNEETAHGMGRRRLAWGLEFVLYGKDGESRRDALEWAVEILDQGGAVAVFAERSSAQGANAPLAATLASELFLKAAERRGDQAPILLVPTSVFIPGRELKVSDCLLYFDHAYDVRELYRTTSSAERPQALAELLEAARQDNVFQLQPEDLKNLESDLEALLMTDLAADWESREGWKQTPEGFRLSAWTRRWIQQTNILNPACLVALRGMLQEYRERRRRASQRQFEVEGAGEWAKSPARRALVWLESLLGLAPALFGLVNHLPAGLTLYAAGVLKKDTGMSRGKRWAAGVLAVLVWYALQILVCYFVWGRAAAGYYLIALPVSGAYAFRYRLLIRRQTRILFLNLLEPVEKSGIGRYRRRFLQVLETAQRDDLKALELPR